MAVNLWVGRDVRVIYTIPICRNTLNLSTPRNVVSLKTKAHFMGIYVDPKYPRNLGNLRSRGCPCPGIEAPYTYFSEYLTHLILSKSEAKYGGN